MRVLADRKGSVMHAKAVAVLTVALMATPSAAQHAGENSRSPKNFPVVQGDYQMTREWKITLPGQFRRRFEEGSLVLWRPGITIWASAWGEKRSTPPRERLKGIKAEASPKRFQELEETGKDGLLRWSYRLKEQAADARVPALYGFVLGNSGYVQLAIYFDREEDASAARALWRSVR